MVSSKCKQASQELSCPVCQFNSRRRALLVATAGLGVAARLGGVTSLAGSFLFSSSAKAANTTVEYDLGKLSAGQMDTVEWMEKPVWIVHRTPEMVAGLKQNDSHLLDPDSRYSSQPAYASGEGRSIRPEYFVCLGVCTHMGCPLNPKPQQGVASGLGEDWTGGFLCLCHGSRFDLAGRVYEGVPATSNLEVPPYSFRDDSHLIIGAGPSIQR